MNFQVFFLVLLSVMVRRVSSVVVDIVCSSDAALYRNGEIMTTVQRGFHSFHVQLVQGDVFAVAMKPPPDTTVTITVKVGIEPRMAWRNTRQWVADGWQQKGWPGACTWEETHTSDITMAYRGGGGGVALFRGVVGDPCSGKYAPKRTLRLTAAANDQAWIFLNGAHLGDVMSVTDVWSQTMTVHDGDVVTLKAMAGGAGGIVASANVDGMDYVTGSMMGGWQVGEANDEMTAKSMIAGFDDCIWTKGEPSTSSITRAPTFPYNTGAVYVWPADATAGARVIARFVVSGNTRCSTTMTKSTTENLCTCEMLPTNAWAKCYFFTDNNHYACDVRQCDPKYVCTSKETGMICMRKQNKERVVPIEGRVGVCQKVADNSFMYVPYGQQS